VNDAKRLGLDDPRDLSITRVLDAPRAAVWRCWVEPELLKQWYCPKPWWVSHAELDVRPGGKSRVVMNGPDGEENDLAGQYLEVVEGERLVATDAFSGDWRPVGTPFIVSIVQFADAPSGRTRMVWGARHWSLADKDRHLAMGFEQGWNAATDQLNDLAKSLA
jgi:uncharacterized protein YndB with AHSA1/START domain